MDVDPQSMAASLASGESPTPETLAWLADGMRKFFRGVSLERALGFDAAGRMRVRNTALVAAAEIIDSGRGLPAWELAGLLQQAIRRYEGNIAPMLSRGNASVEGLSALDAEIHRAFTSGARPVRSRRNLYSLLAR